MKILKTLLRSKLFYLILIFIVLSYVILNLFILKKESIYKENQTVFVGTIKKIKETTYRYSLTLQNKEDLIVYLDKCPYQLGDQVKIIGTLEKPQNNTILNNFNYQEYLKQNQIFYILKAKEIILLKANHNLIFKLKNNLIKYFQDFKSKDYLHAFILGDTSYLKAYESYQINGICHLLAIGSTHITFLNFIIIAILGKMKIKSKNLISLLVIFVYLILTDFPISIFRTFLFLSIATFNKKYKLNLNSLQIFILVISLTIIINPYSLYQKGFLYSYYLSFILILNKDKLTGNNFFKLLQISFLSFLGSLPFNIYFNYEINILSIIYNMFYVPVFNIIIFPLSLLTLVFPFLDNIFYEVMEILNQISIFLNQYKWGIIILKKMPIFVLIIYLVLIVLVTKKILVRKYYSLGLLIFILIIHFNINTLVKKDYFMIIDVKQGDSSLFYSNNETILVDTGGLYQEKISDKTILMLKSLGIKKIDYLFLTHGDYDHMGDSLNLINKFKVQNVIFNNGEYNNLELELIKTLEKKKIAYYQNLKQLNINNNKLYILNNKIYDNENDNSIIIYIKMNNYKLLLMGDAGIDVENDLIDKYNLNNIDILKVGHHGSKTSSSKEFIDYINPKYSVISVGKNNWYGHPNSKVLDILDKSIVYRTDQDGSIIFKFKNNKLNIVKYSP